MREWLREVCWKGRIGWRGFGIMFDSEQWNNLHGEKWTQDRHDLHISLSLSLAIWRPDMGLKAGARMKSISETWVIGEAQELVLTKAFWEPESGQEDQLQSWHLLDRIRTQMEAETKDVYPRFEKTSWLLPQMAFKYPICLNGYWSHDAGKSGWFSVLYRWRHGSGVLQRAILKITV